MAAWAELLVPIKRLRSVAASRDTSLHTHLVVKEDGWQLVGFARLRRAFKKLLAVKGVGALAPGMLRRDGGACLRARRDHDIATLQRHARCRKKRSDDLEHRRQSSRSWRRTHVGRVGRQRRRGWRAMCRSDIVPSSGARRQGCARRRRARQQARKSSAAHCGKVKGGR